jgi:hypothetical protein
MADNRFAEFKAIADTMEGDFEKFYVKGVAAAGTRIRKSLQEMAKLCKEVRKDVTEVKNARKEEKPTATVKPLAKAAFKTAPVTTATTTTKATVTKLAKKAK